MGRVRERMVWYRRDAKATPAKPPARPRIPPTVPPRTTALKKEQQSAKLSLEVGKYPIEIERIEMKLGNACWDALPIVRGFLFLTYNLHVEGCGIFFLDRLIDSRRQKTELERSNCRM
jgi:hypothetical protein